MTDRTFDELCCLQQKAADKVAALLLQEADEIGAGPVSAMSVLDSVVCQVLEGVVERMPQFGPADKLLGILMETLPGSLAADTAYREAGR